MMFRRELKTLLSSAPLREETESVSADPSTSIMITNVIATKEQVFEREFNKLAEYLGEQGVELLNKSFEEKGVQNGTLEEKFEVLKEIATSISKQIHAGTLEAGGGKDFETVKTMYENSYKAAYGVENDIMKRVTDYNTSQQVGAGVVKAAGTMAASLTAAFSGVGLVGVAAITAGTTVGVEVLDRGTSGKALNALREDGVGAYIKTANDDIDWEATLKQAVISGGAVLIGGAVAKGVSVVMEGAKPAAQAIAQFGGDVVFDAGWEYLTTGKITIEGMVFSVLLSAAGNIVAMKQMSKAADAGMVVDDAVTTQTAKTLKDGVDFKTRLADVKGPDGKPFLSKSDIDNLIKNAKNIDNFEARIMAVLSNPEELASLADWKSRSAGVWRAIQDPLQSTVDLNPAVFGVKSKATATAGGTDFASKLADIKGPDGQPFLTKSEIDNLLENCQHGFVTDGAPIPDFEARIMAVLSNPEELASLADWKSRSAGVWRAIQDPLQSTVDLNPAVFLGNTSPERLLKPQTADNIKGQGISFKQSAGQPDYSATRIEWGKTVEETIALNKKNGVNLELVKGDDGQYFLGIKDIWSDGYHRVDRNSVVMHYGDYAPTPENYVAANPEWVKANANPDGTVKDCAVVANDAGARILENSYVTADGQKIDFATMQPGTKVHKDPNAVVNAVAYDSPQTLHTLEGDITTDITMGDVDGNVYNNFKQLKKQITKGQLVANEADPYSARFIELVKAGQDDEAIKLLKEVTKASTASSVASVKPLAQVASTSQCVLPKNMKYDSGNIGNVSVKVASGDITTVKADAYLVPEFNSCASEGGVGGAIWRSGGRKGLEAYDDIVKAQGKQDFGAVHITESGGGNSSKLIHAVTVGSGAENEFEVVQKAVYNALKQAEEQGLSSVAMPALGTGIIGNLTDEQSAQAMMSAIRQFSNEGGQMDVTFVIYGNSKGYNSFTNTMNTGSYASAVSSVGAREFDPARFLMGMANDGTDVVATQAAKAVAETPTIAGTKPVTHAGQTGTLDLSAGMSTSDIDNFMSHCQVYADKNGLTVELGKHKVFKDPVISFRDASGKKVRELMYSGSELFDDTRFSYNSAGQVVNETRYVVSTGKCADNIQYFYDSDGKITYSTKLYDKDMIDVAIWENGKGMRQGPGVFYTQAEAKAKYGIDVDQSMLGTTITSEVTANVPTTQATKALDVPSSAIDDIILDDVDFTPTPREQLLIDLHSNSKTLIKDANDRAKVNYRIDKFVDVVEQLHTMKMPDGSPRFTLDDINTMLLNIRETEWENPTRIFDAIEKADKYGYEKGAFGVWKCLYY